MPCTNIAPVPPPTPGLPLISAATDGGVGWFWQINIDGREKKMWQFTATAHIQLKKRLRLSLSLCVARH